MGRFRLLLQKIVYTYLWNAVHVSDPEAFDLPTVQKLIRICLSDTKHFPKLGDGDDIRILFKELREVRGFLFHLYGFLIREFELSESVGSPHSAD